jgi:hypothetical protein
MLKLLSAALISLAFLSACANPHVNCLEADAFGHCKLWKDQPQPCKNPDFLGFCPPARNS